MRISILKMSIAAALAMASLTLVQAASASYRNRPVNSIIPFNAGGESDVSARFQLAVWEKLSDTQATHVPFS